MRELPITEIDDVEHVLVSVIIPVYNVENYLFQCVRSVQKQTLKQIEIILIDDGSVDESGKLCDKFASQDSRIKVIHQKNGGSTKARNAGLNIACGEYIGFVDSDDWIEPQMYEELFWACKNNNAEISVCGQFCNKGKTEYKEQRSMEEGVYEKSDGAVIHNIFYSDDYKKRGISPNLCDKLFERNLIYKCQAQVDERTKFAEDDLCVYSALLEAEAVVVLNSAFYHYRKRLDSVCTTQDESYFEKITLFYRQMKRVLQLHKESKLLMDKLNRYMLEFVIRGINQSFGFDYGNIVPFFIPPFHTIKVEKIKKIILYGAGIVGQDYYREINKSEVAEILLWVDAQYELYHDKGYNVSAVSEIKHCSDYDVILIAVESPKLANTIRQSLIQKYNVDGKKILYSEPKKLIENI